MAPRQRSALVVAALLVLSAFASAPVAAQAESVAVETDAPTDVTTDSATFHGNLTSLENASDATVWFEYWEQADPDNTTETASLTASAVGPFSIDVVDLEQNTTYVVVAHAETENASAVGSEVTFTTDAEEAVAVSTEDATDVSNTTATLNGELTELQGAANATVWFEYWEDGDRADNSTTTALELDGPAAFSASVDGLANDTTYVYVAHAATENASATGDEVTFTTHDRSSPLGVDTHDATAVTNTAATLNGELTGLSGEAEATVWFEYWVDGDRDNSTTTDEQTLSAPGTFSAAVSGLDNGTTYAYVAHAEANETAVAGDEVEFTTGDDTAERPTWDGEGPFGQWLTSVLKNLVPPGGDVPFGQIVSDIVTSNNPGNGQGPPEHAGANGNNGGGPPDHANNDNEATPTPTPEDDG